jgi:tRNA A-37 threonylcarbamoyl transferase component Bud32/WD40 repeat protein
MPLTPGTQLGPYEIVALIGAGGMGEVYKARDPRLRRDVAIKVLPSSFSSETARLQRFEQEAHAAAGLNHPNICAVYDIGQANGAPYIVSELLEGETLREELRNGALPQRKAIDYAIQIAHGLAAAHDHGIIHRDLKPDNIFITNDGRAKLLDFGLAKLSQPESGDDAKTVTGVLSEAGTVMGTVGYMSPEQVRAKPVDARSDLFSFGVILYEMLSGKRAFQGESAAETMSAIVKEDPPDLAEANRNISPALERIVRHCLEKNPAARFQSAHDLAFNLEAITGTSKSATAIALPAVRTRNWIWPVAAIVALAALAAAFLIGRVSHHTARPDFHQLTFRAGTVYSARFLQDGATLLYSASWEGVPTQIFAGRSDSVEARSLASDTLMLSVSSKNQIAVLLKPVSYSGGTENVATGTLAILPMEGGAPRPIEEDAQWADWTPDGADLAVIRFQHGRGSATALQFPLDKTIYEPERGWISNVRFSPDGKLLAFEEHVPGGDDGKVQVIDRQGKKVAESPHYDSLNGMAWASNDEIWYTAFVGSGGQSLRAMDLKGRAREIYSVPGNLRIYDVAANGRALIGSSEDRLLLVASINGAPQEDLSWFDWSLGYDISNDGSTVVFGESSAAVNGKAAAYLRKTDRSPAVMLGEGQPVAISPDGKWVATLDNESSFNVVLLPTGVGRPQKLTSNGWDFSRVIEWYADGKALLMTAREPGHRARSYRLDIATKNLMPVSPEGVTGCRLSPDDKFMACYAANIPKIYSANGGEIRSLPAIEPTDVFDRWAADGKAMLVWHVGLPMRLDRMDAVTGQRTTVREIKSSDQAGVVSLGPCLSTADTKSYMCSEHRALIDLFVAGELK